MEVLSQGNQGPDRTHQRVPSQSNKGPPQCLPTVPGYRQSMLTATDPDSLVQGLAAYPGCCGPCIPAPVRSKQSTREVLGSALGLSPRGIQSSTRRPILFSFFQHRLHRRGGCFHFQVFFYFNAHHCPSEHQGTRAERMAMAAPEAPNPTRTMVRWYLLTLISCLQGIHLIFPSPQSRGHLLLLGPHRSLMWNTGQAK